MPLPPNSSDQGSREDRGWSAPFCPHCWGEGTVQHNPSSIGDPQCVVDVPCPDCDGNGQR